MQETIDQYFLSDEERVLAEEERILAYLRQNERHRISFELKLSDSGETIRGFFGLRDDKALSALKKKRLIVVRHKLLAPDGNTFRATVKLTEKFAKTLMVEILA